MKLHLNYALFGRPPAYLVSMLTCLSAGARAIQADSKDNAPLSNSWHRLLHSRRPCRPIWQTLTQPALATPAVIETWRKKQILQTARPKKGCFEAKYPETAWREVACKAPLNKLYFPKPPKTVRPETVGGSGPDFSAEVTGAISLAEGSFVSVSPITSECSVPCDPSTDVCPTNPSCTTTSGAVANDYSLQMNTAPFTTNTCAGSPASTSPSCKGWEQFVFPASGGGSIQYWLLNYGPAGTQCPAPRGASCVPGGVSTDGWCPFQFSSTGNVFCVVNAAGSTTAPAVLPTSNEFPTLTLSGEAGSSTTKDQIIVSVGGTAHGAVGGNYFPDLGYGNKLAGGGVQCLWRCGREPGLIQSRFDYRSADRRDEHAATANAPSCERASRANRAT